MADIAELAIRVETLELKRANRDMDQFGKTAKKTADGTASSMRRMGAAVAGTLAGLGIAAFSRQIIANTIEQERVIAQLDQTLRSTGRYTPELSQQMQDFASALQGVTTYGDEAVIAAQAMLLTFTQIGGETFGRAQQAILDVATAMGTDLKSATLQVGKALNDPIKGVSALAESGIQFTDVQRDMIKAMVEAGDVAEAQAVILGELETQFGGSARAARDTLGGSLQSLKNAFGDLLEGDSGGDGVRGATQAINDLTDTLSDPATKQAFANVTGLVVGMVEALANAVTGFDNLTTSIADYVQGIQTRGMTETQRLAQEIKQITIEANELEATLQSPDWILRIRGLDRGELEARLRSARLTAQGLQSTLGEMQVSDDVADILERLGGFGGETIEGPTVPSLGGGGGAGGITDELKKQQDEIAKTIEGYQQQADTLGMSGVELELYKLQMQGATDEQIRQAATLLQLAEAYRIQEEARADEQARIEQTAREVAAIEDQMRTEEQIIQDSYERRRAIVEQATIDDGVNRTALLEKLEMERNEKMAALERERITAVLSMNEELFGGLSGLAQAYAGEQSGLYKAMFAVEKGFAVAKALINAPQAFSDAYTAVVGIPIVGPILAPIAGATAAAAQVAQAGAIRSVNPSFEGGGFTGYGARSGGVDGKGGFPAILHPNETVVDHAQGQSLGGTVVNINNAPSGTTVNRSQDADGRDVIDVMIADMRSDGPASRQMRQTFGLSRRGS